jgi:hypothetical protein
MRRLAPYLMNYVLALGCTRPCADKTIFLTVDYDDAAASADKVGVIVFNMSDGMTTTFTFDHTKGQSPETLALPFRSGYPFGHSVSVTATAIKQGRSVATGSNMVTLSRNCATLEVEVNMPPRVDMSMPPPDLSPPPDMLMPVAIMPRGNPIVESLLPDRPDASVTLTAGLPNTTQSNDLVLAVLEGGNETPPTMSKMMITTPPSSAWNNFIVKDHPLPADMGAGNPVAFIAVYSLVATRADINNQAAFTCTLASGVPGILVIAAYGNVDTSKPIEAHQAKDDANIQNMTAYQTPQISTTTKNAMLVAGFAGFTMHAATTTWPMPTPGMTLVNPMQGDGHRRSLAVFNGFGPTAVGAVGPYSSTPMALTQTTSLPEQQQYALSFLLALRPLFPDVTPTK